MATMEDESGNERPTSADSVRVTRAILVLLAADRDERVDVSPPRKSELVLADAGFSAREISTMIGRNYEAVRSALRRKARSE